LILRRLPLAGAHLPPGSRSKARIHPRSPQLAASLVLMLIGSRRTISACAGHGNSAAVALVDQIKNVSGCLEPLNARRRRPFCFRLWQRFEKALHEGMQIAKIWYWPLFRSHWSLLNLKVAAFRLPLCQHHTTMTWSEVGRTAHELGLRHGLNASAYARRQAERHTAPGLHLFESRASWSRHGRTGSYGRRQRSKRFEYSLDLRLAPVPTCRGHFVFERGF